MNVVAADDDDEFEPPIQPMISNQPRNLNVKKKQKKLHLQDDDDDFEVPIKDLIGKRAENTKKRPKTSNDQNDDDFEPVKKTIERRQTDGT
ncbi:hypothetical protein Hanom_Chr01g00006931 [Helianthus anomalus]